MIPGASPPLPNCYRRWYRFVMPKIRRGGFVFLAWAGDHGPRHVHVYRDGELVVKWDLENWQPMKGASTRRVEALLRELVEEGRL